jgi:hypothetical protein
MTAAAAHWQGRAADRHRRACPADRCIGSSCAGNAPARRLINCGPGSCCPHRASPCSWHVRRHRCGGRCDPRRLPAAWRVRGRGRVASSCFRASPTTWRRGSARGPSPAGVAAAVTPGPLTRDGVALRRWHYRPLASLSSTSPWQGRGAHQQTRSRPRSSGSASISCQLWL